MFPDLLVQLLGWALLLVVLAIPVALFMVLRLFHRWLWCLPPFVRDRTGRHWVGYPKDTL